MDNVPHLQRFVSSLDPLVELKRIASMITFYRETAFADPFASQEDKASAMESIQRLNRQQDQVRREIRQ